MSRVVWMTPDARQVFLVPAGTELPAGDSPLRRPFTTEETQVDLAAMERWKVDGERLWNERKPTGGHPPGADGEAVHKLGRAVAEELRKPEVKAAAATLGEALARALHRAEG